MVVSNLILLKQWLEICQNHIYVQIYSCLFIELCIYLNEFNFTSKSASNNNCETKYNLIVVENEYNFQAIPLYFCNYYCCYTNESLKMNDFVQECAHFLLRHLINCIYQRKTNINKTLDLSTFRYIYLIYSLINNTYIVA